MRASFARAARRPRACSILPATSPQRVQRAGIDAFEDLGLCTYAEPERFFSYRRMTTAGEPDYGRHINAIALAD